MEKYKISEKGKKYLKKAAAFGVGAALIASSYVGGVLANDDIEKQVNEELNNETKITQEVDHDFDFKFDYNRVSHDDFREIYDTTGEGVDFKYDSSNKFEIDTNIGFKDSGLIIGGNYSNKSFSGDMIYGEDKNVGDSSKKASIILGRLGYNIDEDTIIHTGYGSISGERIANFIDDDRDYGTDFNDSIVEIGLNHSGKSDENKINLEFILDRAINDNNTGIRGNVDIESNGNRFGVNLDNSAKSEYLVDRLIDFYGLRSINVNDESSIKNSEIGLSYQNSLEEGIDNMIGLIGSLETEEGLNIDLRLKRSLNSDTSGLNISFEYDY